jgi:hypothetical protein
MFCSVPVSVSVSVSVSDENTCPDGDVPVFAGDRDGSYQQIRASKNLRRNYARVNRLDLTVPAL